MLSCSAGSGRGFPDHPDRKAAMIARAIESTHECQFLTMVMHLGGWPMEYRFRSLKPVLRVGTRIGARTGACSSAHTGTRIEARIIACICAAGLVALLAGSASAVIVFEDHFTGNSGGMPAGWSWFSTPGTVTESGTTVTCTEDAGIWTDGTIDPSQGDVTIAVDVVGMTGRADGGWGFIVPSVEAYVWVGLRLADGRLQMGATDNGGSAEEHYQLGYLSGYVGAPIHLELVLGATSFSLSADSPPFFSGWIEYTAAFSTFTREDLGTAVRIVIGDDVGEGEYGASIFDRVAVSADPASAAKTTTFGGIKALYH
jgi:hypothetical protein